MFKIDYASIKKPHSTYCTVQVHCAVDIYVGTKKYKKVHSLY